MNIEPATLLIVRCPYIDLSITLLEYLITEMDKYDPIDPDKKVWKGIHNSIDACLKMKVVRYVHASGFQPTMSGIYLRWKGVCRSVNS